MIQEVCFCQLPREEIRSRDLNLQIFKLTSSCFESFFLQVQLSSITVCLQQLAFFRPLFAVFVSIISFVLGFTDSMCVCLFN